MVALSFEEADQLKTLARLRAFIKQYGIDYTVLVPGEPELATVVREPAMVRSVATPYRLTIEDFAVGGRAGFDIHDNKLVRTIAESLHPECPDIHKFFLAFDPSQIRG